MKSLFLLLLLFSTSVFAKSLELTESNHILLRGAITDESVTKIIHAINISKEKELTIFIDSPGGSVTAGFKLMKVIEHSGKKITCIASSAASMAFAVLQSCQVRLVMDDSIVMQHVMSYTMQGQEPNNYSLAGLLHRINIAMDKKQAKRIGISYESFRAKVRDDWWLFGDEAVTSNVADDVINVSCSSALSLKTTKETMQLFFTEITVVWSGCPLTPGPIAIMQSKNSPAVTEVQASQELKEYLRVNSALGYFEDRAKRK